MPAIIISAITAALSSLFTVFVNFFVTFLTKRLAFNAAAVAVFLSLTTAFIFALRGLFLGISYAMPNEIVIAISWFMPSNASACIAAYLSAMTARYIYDVNQKVFSLFARL